MNKIVISFFILSILYSSTIFAEKIVAVVNDTPITSYEVETRKKITLFFSGLKSVEAKKDKEITKYVLNNLIEEKILLQEAKRKNIKVQEEEINKHIAKIENENNIPNNYIALSMQEVGINYNDFREKIRITILQDKITEYFLLNNENETIAQKNIDRLLINFNKPATVRFLSFTCTNSDSNYKKMLKLKQKICNCNNVHSTSYKNFAKLEDITTKINSLDPQTQSIIKDLQIGFGSEIFKTSNGIKFIYLCNKNIENITPQEQDNVLNSILQRKRSIKIQKFFENLIKKAYIKIY